MQALEECSPAARELVAKFLTYNPAKRITAEVALSHPWLSGGEASGKVLKVQENLRSWRARMRFKTAIVATVATTRSPHTPEPSPPSHASHGAVRLRGDALRRVERGEEGG